MSYLATGGNSETTSAGLDAELHKDWPRWSFSAASSAVRATDGGAKTAERESLSGRGDRKLSARLSWTSGLAAERDPFAGLDLRTVADSGLAWKLVDGDRWHLGATTSLSYTREQRTGTAENAAFLGALTALEAGWTISAGSAITGRLAAYPDFEQSDDFRLEAKLAVESALNRRLALKLSTSLKYDHLPVPGFETTDTATTASLVVRWGRLPTPES